MIANIDIDGKVHGAIMLNGPFEPDDKDTYRNGIIDALQFINETSDDMLYPLPTGAVDTLLEILRAFDEQTKELIIDEDS